MEPNHRVFASLRQKEACGSNPLRDPRHVRHSPRHDQVYRYRQPGLDFLQEVPVALAQGVVEELVLKIGGRGEAPAPYTDSRFLDE